MCGRFTVATPDKIKKRFEATNELPDFSPSWNVAPSMMVPTITRNSPNKIIMMKWGLIFSKKLRIRNHKPQDRID